MTQVVILALGKTVAVSTDITLAANASVTVGLYTDNPAGEPPVRPEVWLVCVTPGVVRRFANLSKVVQQKLVGPGIFRVLRPDITEHGVNIGVYTDT
jgi:hypothetical protein